MKNISVMEINGENRTEGMLYIIFGVLFMVLSPFMKYDRCSEFTTPLVVSLCIGAGLVITGVYFIMFKKKTSKIDITLGSISHRLYVFNKVLFFLYHSLKIVLMLGLIKLTVAIISYGIPFTWAEFDEVLKMSPLLIIIILYIPVREWYAYYLYYKSPEKAKKIL